MSEYKPKYKISFTKESRLNKKPDYMGDFTYDLIQQLYIRCDERDKEIERLNNIIDQTQKILYIKLMNENKEKIYIQEVIDIIENLKGSDKE